MRAGKWLPVVAGTITSAVGGAILTEMLNPTPLGGELPPHMRNRPQVPQSGTSGDSAPNSELVKEIFGNHLFER
jgi:hypothetical protein